MAMEGLKEKTTGTLEMAVEDCARANRCVDKTLQTLVETMVKMNRNIERIGEEVRRELERHWKAEERKTKEDSEKENRNTEKRNINCRRETERDHKGKENHDKKNKPLKSVINKK